MQQRISAGGIIIDDKKRVLLVNHQKKDKYDFWVLPGGRSEGNEGIFQCVKREIYEETNLKVIPEKIVYFEEILDEETYTCKFWLVCTLLSQEISLKNKENEETFLVDIDFFTKEQISSMNVYPKILKGIFWNDLNTGFKNIRYLGKSTSFNINNKEVSKFLDDIK